MPVKVGSAEVDTAPGELAGLLRRLSRQSRGASAAEHCRRPLGISAFDPELDVAVLTRDPADPRIEAPAAEQPRGDAGCPSVFTTALMTRSCESARSLTASVCPGAAPFGKVVVSSWTADAAARAANNSHVISCPVVSVPLTRNGFVLRVAHAAGPGSTSPKTPATAIHPERRGQRKPQTVSCDGGESVRRVALECRWIGVVFD
jgi:hypothetical protein